MGNAGGGDVLMLDCPPPPTPPFYSSVPLLPPPLTLRCFIPSILPPLPPLSSSLLSGAAFSSRPRYILHSTSIPQMNKQACVLLFGAAPPPPSPILFLSPPTPTPTPNSLPPPPPPPSPFRYCIPPILSTWTPPPPPSPPFFLLFPYSIHSKLSRR